LSNRLSNRFDNRFDNRLYRVNGALRLPRSAMTLADYNVLQVFHLLMSGEFDTFLFIGKAP